ncbi:hypothetical protein K457DRAFT_549895 [Linnemannia elongata AG-77]|uniref:Uncharacterized protein n=1 Tax=Linnemannia elongata AG-77 TaxID=1314771 RepID=A0A197JBX0_9FUNG|nr:hypothetical protein K457DRAFT_549895 [Linnemannia elongata AG-77]
MTQEVYDAVGRYLEKDSDPKRIAAKKLLQEEDKTCCPEWRQLYSSIPLGKLPSVEDCNNLAPLKLKVLALVPIRELLHRPESDTPTMQPSPKPTGKSKKPAPPKPPALRANSSTLFCYRKIDEEFHCLLPRIVNGVEMACGHHPQASHGNTIRRNHLISQHPGILDAIEHFQAQQKIAISLRQLSNPETPNTSKRSKKSINTTDSAVPLWNDSQQDAAVNQLMRLVAVEGVPFSAATSKTLKTLCQMLNPRFRFPCTTTLKSRLRQVVERRKAQTVNYFHTNVTRGAITADGWTI